MAAFTIEDAMHITGVILGWVIAAGYVWAVLHFFARRARMLSPDATSRKRFARAVMKSHIYVPLFLLMVIVLHFLVEIIHNGFFLTGVVTISLMLLQIILGAYGAYAKDRKKGPWFYAHRTVAIALAAAIPIHVTTVIILQP